jgi:hypothetical protein
MKKNIVIWTFALFLINSLSAQNSSELSNEQLVTYSMEKYWTDPSIAKLFEDKYQLKMQECFNNYSSREALFIQVHSVCKDSKFLGNVYSISYRDKDHLGKLRIYISKNLALNQNAVAKNKANISELVNIHNDFPYKFDPTQGLIAISSIGLIGENKCAGN